MKNNLLLLIIIISFFSCSQESTSIEVGKNIPNYTFEEVLNRDQKPFSLRNQNKPVIIEFWASWCAPCIPAMDKLEGFQDTYVDKIEIITVSSDHKQNLYKYIKNTNTTLRIAFDTIHQKTFNYKHIPHSILIDKNGIIQAITTPDKITEQIINDLIEGKALNIQADEEIDVTNLGLNIEFKSNDYQYQLTSENKNLGFKNEIKRNHNNQPIALYFQNVSIYRLMTDLYELSSAARIYSQEEISAKNKYCFKLEQIDTYKKDLLENAKEILNSNLDVKAAIIEKEMDSVYVLEIINESKLPKKSTEQRKYIEYRGPYFLGKKISSYNLIEYLENEVQQPIKDKVELDYSFDMELNWNYEGGGQSLNKALEKYGLKIKKASTPEKLRLLELTRNSGSS